MFTSKISIGTKIDPTGESLDTVFGQLLLRNQLDFNELWNRFTKNKKYANERDQFDYRTIKTMTGWEKEAIQYSTTDGFPLIGNGASGNKPMRTIRGSSSAWHTILRTCSECTKIGIHLLFHQSVHWDKCPIHGCHLNSECFNCGSQNAQFGNSRTSLSGYQCEECGIVPYISSDASDDFNKHKSNLVREYATWIYEVETKINGQHKNVIWASLPSDSTMLAEIYKLFGGPKWLSKCLSGFDSLKLVSHSIDGASPPTKPQKSVTGFMIPHGTHRDTYRDNKVDKNDRNHALPIQWRSKELIYEVYHDADTEMWQEVVKNSKCMKSIYDYCHFECPYYRSLERFYKGEKDFTYCGGAGTGVFWGSWREGPGKDFQVGFSREGVARIRNQEYTIAVSKVWMKAVLLSELRSYLSHRFIRKRFERPMFALKKCGEHKLILLEVTASKPLSEDLNALCVGRRRKQ